MLVTQQIGAGEYARVLSAELTSFRDFVHRYRALGDVAPHLDDVLPSVRAIGLRSRSLARGRMLASGHDPLPPDRLVAKCDLTAPYRSSAEQAQQAYPLIRVDRQYYSGYLGGAERLIMPNACLAPPKSLRLPRSGGSRRRSVKSPPVRSSILRAKRRPSYQLHVPA